MHGICCALDHHSQHGKHFQFSFKRSNVSKTLCCSWCKFMVIRYKDHDHWLLSDFQRTTYVFICSITLEKNCFNLAFFVMLES
jgi:hypothetical protein